jgi:hypothetical protein
LIGFLGEGMLNMPQKFNVVIEQDEALLEVWQITLN